MVGGLIPNPQSLIPVLKAPPSRIELELPAPEAGALSFTLRGPDPILDDFQNFVNAQANSVCRKPAQELLYPMSGEVAELA